MSLSPERADRWLYRGLWSILVTWLRVPSRAPTLPATDAGEASRFRPDRGFLGYLRLSFFILWGIVAIVWVGAMVVLLIAVVSQTEMWWLPVLFGLLALFCLVIAAMGFVALHLRFDTTWYVMSDRSLRIRRGIWVLQEVTVTFENVQNVKVSQGPLQRVFGIASVVVETAGGGTAGQPGTSSNQAIIEGVANADELRGRILTRLKASTTAGLGDEASEVASGWTPAHVTALVAIRDEIRGWRNPDAAASV